MTKISVDLKNILRKIKGVQVQFKKTFDGKSVAVEAKKYADRQSKDLKKLINQDIEKVRSFLEDQKSEVERFQKQIPAEVKKWSQYLTSQRKELESILRTVSSGTAPKKKGSSKPKAKKSASPAKKRTRAKKTSSTVSSSG